jgi:hypothetical protein
VVRVLALLALLSSCESVKEIGGGAGLNLTWIPGVGQVFQCEYADGGGAEFCFDGDADELAQQLVAAGVSADAACEPTPRHIGVCLACCDDDCGRGANALHGTWCR